MGCLKCGKKTEAEQSFCPACLKAMELYPVKSDVPIQLPLRRSAPAPKKAARKRRTMSVEEQALSFRKRSRWLTGLTILLLMLLAVSVAILIRCWHSAGGFALPRIPLFHVKQLG